MAHPHISLIIVSRDRAEALSSALNCLRFQTVSGFETIVVSNLPATTGPAPAPLAHYDCQPANISLARNIGLAKAKGDIVVFCDDDCLPDPRFIELITAPFADRHVGAAGGMSRGTNGVAMQWQAVSFGRDGRDKPLTIDLRKPWTVFAPEPERFIKTVGTACAFRADALRAIGGFDEGYRYYFDETDVNLRLSEAGWSTAIVPTAQVHHAFAAGPHRDRRRMPTDMFEIGASAARFCTLHVARDSGAALNAQRRNLRNRLHNYHLLGLISGQRLRFLLARLDEGIAQTFANFTPPPKLEPIPVPGPQISLPEPQPRLHFLLEGSLARMRPLARALAEAGHVVTVLEIRATIRPLWAFFDADGFWYHRGGLFGRIKRNETLLNLRTKPQYLAVELRRLAWFRRVNYMICDRKPTSPALILPELKTIENIDSMTVIDLQSNTP
ncbi:MAG: glycosyltransferase [Paracoccaceae bacterium]